MDVAIPRSRTRTRSGRRADEVTAAAEPSSGARNEQAQGTRERLLPLQLHALSIGMRTILLVPLLSAAVLVVGRRTDVEMGPFGFAFVIVAVGAGLATLLPYERLFRTRWGMPVVFAWSVVILALIASGIWATGASSSSRLLRAQRRELLGRTRCLEIESGEPGGTGGPRLPCEPAGWSAEESDGRPQGGTPGVRAPVGGSGRGLGGRTRHERRRTGGGPPGRRGFGRCPGLSDDPDLRAGGSGLSSDPSFGRPRGHAGGDRLASLRGNRARADRGAARGHGHR